MFGPRISASTRQADSSERRAHDQEQQKSDAHRWLEPTSLVGERLDAEVPALELGVRRELSRRRLVRDLPADHDQLPLGDRRRDAEILLDDENREAFLLES